MLTRIVCCVVMAATYWRFFQVMFSETDRLFYSIGYPLLLLLSAFLIGAALERFILQRRKPWGLVSASLLFLFFSLGNILNADVETVAYSSPVPILPQEVSAFLQDMKDDLDGIHERFQADAASVEGLLDPDALTNPMIFDEVRELFPALKVSLNLYDSEIHRHYNVTLSEKSEALDLDPKLQKEMWVFVQQARRDMLPLEEQFIELQHQELALLEEYFVFMEDRLDQFTVVDGEVIFENPADHAKYESFIDRSEQLLADESELFEDSGE